MRYLGGKGRTGHIIAQYLNAIRFDNQSYWEPFVGGGWVLSNISASGKNHASDKHVALISMWQSLLDGWQPPNTISEDEYEDAKSLPDTDPLKAFIGFGCSFSGKYFGGYARSGKRNYASNARNSLFRKIASMPPVTFYHADFMTCDPPESHMLIYCDPPYNNTTGYSTGDFNTSAFYNRCRTLSASGHTVIISEYAAPSDFSCVLQIPTKTDMRNTNGNREDRTEKLFTPADPIIVQPKLF